MTLVVCVAIGIEWPGAGQASHFTWLIVPSLFGG